MCNCALITDLHSRAVFVLIVSAWRSVNIFIDRSFKGYSGFFWAVSLLAYKFIYLFFSSQFLHFKRHCSYCVSFLFKSRLMTRVRCTCSL